LQGKSGEKKNQYEGVVGGGTNKNRTKLGGGRERVKTDKKTNKIGRKERGGKKPGEVGGGQK
jgi:hypothetical protein